MLDHPRHVVLAAAVAGLLLGPRTGWAAWVLAAALVAWAALGAPRARETAHGWLGVLASLALAAGALVADARLRAIDRTALAPLIGHAADERATVLQAPRRRSHGRVAFLAAVAGERVLVVGEGLRVQPGDVARVRGGWAALPAYESVARRAGAHALLRAESADVVGRRRGVLGAVDSVRRRAEAALERGLPPPLAALARGMVLGQDDALSDATAEEFRASGLAHLVAASGANVALLATLVLALCALAGVPRAARLWLAIGLIALYVPLAGGGPSIQRAGVMGAATLVAALASRPSSRWYALLLAAVATLILNPRAAEDPGWQLSFAAVVSLMTLAPRLERWMPKAVALSVAASAATAPLIALHFDRVSWVTVPANLLVLPAVAPIMWLGTLAAALGQVSARAAGLLAALAALPLAFVGGVAHHAAGAEIPLPRPAPPTRLTISALDVGQGDATLIQHSGRAVLVDTGPPDGAIVERLRERGVRRLDLLVVTHAQADHQGATQAVLDAFPTGMVLDGRDGLPGEWRAPAGTRVTPGTAGQRLRVGEIVLDVLHPPPGDSTGQDPNLRALVLLTRIGATDVLLPADAESEVLSRLALPDVDVLKVSHHGSADPGLPALLERIRPEIALIEVGERNTYGHPAPSTLQALAGLDVRRTDEHGTVVLQP